MAPIPGEGSLHNAFLLQQQTPFRLRQPYDVQGPYTQCTFVSESADQETVESMTCSAFHTPYNASVCDPSSQSSLLAIRIIMVLALAALLSEGVWLSVAFARRRRHLREGGVRLLSDEMEKGRKYGRSGHCLERTARCGGSGARRSPGTGLQWADVIDDEDDEFNFPVL